MSNLNSENSNIHYMQKFEVNFIIPGMCKGRWPCFLKTVDSMTFIRHDQICFELGAVKITALVNVIIMHLFPLCYGDMKIFSQKKIHISKGHCMREI